MRATERASMVDVGGLGWGLGGGTGVAGRGTKACIVGGRQVSEGASVLEVRIEEHSCTIERMRFRTGATGQAGTVSQQ